MKIIFALFFALAIVSTMAFRSRMETEAEYTPGNLADDTWFFGKHFLIQMQCYKDADSIKWACEHHLNKAGHKGCDVEYADANKRCTYSEPHTRAIYDQWRADGF